MKIHDLDFSKTSNKILFYFSFITSIHKIAFDRKLANLTYMWKISKLDLLKNDLKKNFFFELIFYVESYICLYNFKYIYLKLLLIYVMPSVNVSE